MHRRGFILLLPFLTFKLEITVVDLSSFLATCEHSHFEPLLGQDFRAHVGKGDPRQLKLAEVNDFPAQQNEGFRVPFSLLFESADDHPVADLSGLTIQLSNDQIETIAVLGHAVSVPGKGPGQGPKIYLEVMIA